MSVEGQRRFEPSQHWDAQSATKEAGKFANGRFRIICLSSLGMLLLYHIVTKDFSAYLSYSNPEAAIFLNSNNSTALVNLAEDKLAADRSFTLLDPVLSPLRNSGPGSVVAKSEEATAEEIDADTAQSTPTAPVSTLDQNAIAEIQQLALRAIASDPLNARAFRILGQISDRTSDVVPTEKYMRAAVERSLRESVAVYWMMRKSFQDQNYKEALRYADILLRTRPQALPHIVPIVGKMAEVPAAAPDVKALLASNPPWRPQFFAYFPKTITDARTPLDVLLSLKENANPPSALELRPYLDFLIEHGFFDLAYYTWLQFLPPEQLAQAGNLFNAGFDAPPSGTPFDWVLTKGTGVTAQVAAKSDRPGERALHLKFGPGRVDYREITQLIMLSPGSYQFNGKYKGDLISERGLEWRVLCAAKDRTIIGRGVVSRGTNTQWKELEFEFTVPQQDCAAQFIKLVFDARSASEKFISGNIWFDDFKVSRDQTTEESEPAEASLPSAQQPVATQNAQPPTSDSQLQPPTSFGPSGSAFAPDFAQPPASLIPTNPPAVTEQPTQPVTPSAPSEAPAAPTGPQ